MTSEHRSAYSGANSLVDYILGITYEIWEEGQVDLIDHYYGPDTVVYGLDGITRGASGAIAGTRATLAAYPDRLLLADDVIGKGDARDGYSSHRVLSPMTNLGDTPYGPATGRQVRIMNMADCVVESGMITREWLARDNLALVRQLGFDALDSAKIIAAKRNDELTDWLASESARVADSATSPCIAGGVDHQLLLDALWKTGSSDIFDSAYVHYSVMHRSPVEIVSGGPAIRLHFAMLRDAFDIEAVLVDHVCEQDGGDDVCHVAIRWSVCGSHVGTWHGIDATGKPVFIMGVSHRRIVNQRIAVEWTVFDTLGVMAQLLP